MKNIKKSIFLAMIVVASVSGMEEFSPVAQTMRGISNIQKMMLSMDEHQKRQQRAMETHQQSQHIVMENHQLGQQVAHDNHTLNQQQAKDRLEMAKDNHQIHQQEAKHRQQVDRDNHANYQRSLIDKQLHDLKEQRRKREKQDAASRVHYYNNKIETALAKAELQKVETEHNFRKCLVSHMDSSELGSSGIPKVCDNLAKQLRILGSGSIVKELTEAFQGQ